MPELQLRSTQACRKGCPLFAYQQYKRMKKAICTLTTRVGRVQRGIERKIDRTPETHQAQTRDLLYRINRSRAQKPKDKNKLYAVHAPEVECIYKGKALKPDEFGVKVSVLATPQ